MTQRRETPDPKFHDDPDQFIIPHLLRELKNDCACGVCELLREAVEDGFKAPAGASASVIAEIPLDRQCKELRKIVEEVSKVAGQERQRGEQAEAKLASVIAELQLLIDEWRKRTPEYSTWDDAADTLWVLLSRLQKGDK